MSPNSPTDTAAAALDQVAAELRQAAETRKCWSCGCFRGALATVEQALPADRRPAALATVLETGRQRLVESSYDCLGCSVCWPANATNALAQAGVVDEAALLACPTEAVEARAGWPPLPGAYTVLRYGAPVAVCALASEDLVAAVTRSAEAGLAIAGTLFTENLGIERLISNVLANPHIRYLVVCGADSKQAIGHLPGQSLLALATGGIDVRSRIIGARGKRPVLKNISQEAVEHFRATVTVIDRVGEQDPAAIAQVVRELATLDPLPAPAFGPTQVLVPVAGHLPERMVPDPLGYFVVYTEPRRGLLVLEHYGKDGVLDTVIEGRSAGELYVPAVERQLLSRLDHAAYLGRELARAEASLAHGRPFVQDGAPERPAHRPAACGCNSSCGGNS